MRSWLFWIALCCATWTGSCIDAMRWERQDVHLRYDARTDVAELLIVYDDVFAGPKGVVQALRVVEAVGAKKRYFAIGDWPAEFDLDECVAGAGANPLESLAKRSPPPGSPEALAIEFFRGVEVIEASLHLEGPGFLSLVQHIRLPHFSLAVRTANLALSREIAESTATAAEFTETEWNAWREHARSGKPWIAVGGEGLEFRAPHGSRWLARLLGVVASGEDQPVVAGVASALSELALQDGLAVFRWKPDESGIITLHFSAPHGDPKRADSELAERVAESGLPLERAEPAGARVLRFRRE